jgi:multidrug efflux system membrane fusion protein
MLALAVAAGAYWARPQRAAGSTPAAPPAVPVTVTTLVPHKLRVWSEFPGRLRAVDAAEIRPEVGGRITAVMFQDGQAVKAGDVLFVIDPRPYEAAVARARANLASARTRAAFAEAEFKRAAALIGTHAIPKRLYDERANDRRVATAAVGSAEAELEQARLDLEHSSVRAPISGRAGRVEITVGNSVQPGPNAPLLTTVVASTPIYADFEVDEQTYVEGIREHAVGRDAERRIPVELSLRDGDGRSYRGHVYSFDNRIDAASGTIRARARFDNADGALLPGMFVSVRLAEAVERSALLVPERAIGFDQNKAFVYVVGQGNRVAYRQVRLGKAVGAQRITLDGLAPGDRVIVDGIQHVRPNVTVAAREAAPDGPSGGAGRHADASQAAGG